MSEKKRLDLMVFEKGLAESREKSKAIIMAAQVCVNGQMIDKPSQIVTCDDEISIKGKLHGYVGRGGLKLEKALKIFELDLTDKTCLDVGASTGGFTDCMLQNGAETVYALDVGYGQLDYRLRCDNRVVVMERKNARLMQSDWFEKAIEFATMDVSFISISLILKPLYSVLVNNSKVVVLIKPQFEAGRELVGKHGVVKDAKVHVQVIKNCFKYALRVGFGVDMLDFSPITGPKGNIEYLMLLSKTDNSICGVSENEIVDLAEIAKNNFTVTEL